MWWWRREHIRALMVILPVMILIFVAAGIIAEFTGIRGDLVAGCLGLLTLIGYGIHKRSQHLENQRQLKAQEAAVHQQNQAISKKFGKFGQL